MQPLEGKTMPGRWFSHDSRAWVRKDRSDGTLTAWTFLGEAPCHQDICWDKRCAPKQLMSSWQTAFYEHMHLWKKSMMHCTSRLNCSSLLSWDYWQSAFSAVSYFPSQTSLWHQKQGHQSSDRISVKAVADKPRNCLLFTPMCYKPVSCFYRELSF